METVLLGGVSNYVLHYAAIPVLIVRKKGAVHHEAAPFFVIP